MYQAKNTARLRRLLVAALALGSAFGTVAHAQLQLPGQNVTPPPTPTLITPPEGSTPFLLGHAVGTQGYICLPTSPGASTAAWTKNGRPQATLFQTFFNQDFQIVTHFLSPDTNHNMFAPDPLPFGNATWQSSFDSSKVWAAVLHGNQIDAGSHPSCPNSGAIPCLLLQSIGSDIGPTGGNTLAKTTFIQRLNTKGGAAPLDSCATSDDVGNQRLVPYKADYYFYR